MTTIYNLQRLRAIDRIVGDLIQFYKHRAIRVILLSEYGITAVNHAVHLNPEPRAAGAGLDRDP